MDNTIRYLFNQVYQISKKYEEIEQITGENFNIFQVLKLQSDEVRLHSRLIGDLLNPKGFHGFGSFFLQMFCEIVGLKEYSKEDLADAKVIVEEYIGVIDKDYNQGGFIDIIIKPPSRIPIIIENKIYAPDQKHQLLRYKKAYPDSNLFYLNPFGSNPNEISINNTIKLLTDKDFKIISYEKEIIKWLELCLPITIDKPFLRETLMQYLKSINVITNQASNNKMEQEILTQIIQSKENLLAAFKISNTLKPVKEFLFNKLRKNLWDWALQENYEVIDGGDDESKQWGWGDNKETFIEFKKQKPEITITLGFDIMRYSDFFIGVDLCDDLVDYQTIKIKVANILTPILGRDKNYPYWTYLHYFSDEWASWDNGEEIWIKILNGEALKQLQEWITAIWNEIKIIENLNSI